MSAGQSGAMTSTHGAMFRIGSERHSTLTAALVLGHRSIALRQFAFFVGVTFAGFVTTFVQSEFTGLAGVALFANAFSSQFAFTVDTWRIADH